MTQELKNGIVMAPKLTEKWELEYKISVSMGYLQNCVLSRNTPNRIRPTETQRWQ